MKIVNGRTTKGDSMQPQDYLREEQTMTHATPRPWKVLYGYDTHKVKRDRNGRIVGPVTLDFDDYMLALHAVNTHERAKAVLRNFVEAEEEWMKERAGMNASFDDHLGSAYRQAKALLIDMAG